MGFIIVSWRTEFMNILKVTARNFKNLADDVEIDFVAKSRKTSEDKEYELQEIADGLYVFTTMAFVGKNASGKTTALDLLSVAYDIISMFRVSRDYSLNDVELCIYFYDDGYIYKYSTKLVQNALAKNAVFKDEYISRKKYFKSYLNDIYKDDFENMRLDAKLPDDVSKIFLVLEKRPLNAIFFNDNMESVASYDATFDFKDFFEIDDSILQKVLNIFDENVLGITKDENGNYDLNYGGQVKKLTASELYLVLSSGTTKGMILYTLIVASLKYGFTILIDEIENHFHKTLVENIISLYKDKSVNKKNASLIFSTHYCELLDLFNRQDNIYIANADSKVHLNSIYDKYDVRNDILKSKQFYNNTFKTAVNYEALMDLKKALK